MWADGHKNGAESDAEAQSEPTETPGGAHYCHKHQAEYQEHHRGENVWYSHKTPQGKWCPPQEKLGGGG